MLCLSKPVACVVLTRLLNNFYSLYSALVLSQTIFTLQIFSKTPVYLWCMEVALDRRQELHISGNTNKANISFSKKKKLRYFEIVKPFLRLVWEIPLFEKNWRIIPRLFDENHLYYAIFIQYKWHLSFILRDLNKLVFLLIQYDCTKILVSDQKRSRCCNQLIARIKQKFPANQKRQFFVDVILG